ncbi:MAG: class II fructose-bisphosphatase [Saccharospirillum sp.]
MPANTSLDWIEITEAAAIAGHAWLGRGDKNAADQAAVSAMRLLLNQTAISGEIVIGEGEIDDAPMLYIGEQVGTGGRAIDIAVDPIEGTRMTAMGQGNAITVLAAAAKGSLLNAPDMYMDKLATGPAGKGALDISKPLLDNLHALAKTLGKPVSDLTVATLAKPRHDARIRQMRKAGVRVFEIPDGDVALALMAALPDHPVDLMMSIGGAPEGVIAAAAIRALGGDMQARLMLREDAKGASDENRSWSQKEAERCQALGLTPGDPMALTDLARSDDVLFAATGITQGDLLSGVRNYQGQVTTESLLIRGKQGDWRTITTTQPLERLPSELQGLLSFV